LGRLDLLLPVLIVVLLAGFSSDARAISIQLSFGTGFTTAEQLVTREAASRWESLIVSNEMFAINVSKSLLAPTQLGFASGYTSTGGTLMNGRQAGTPTGGNIAFNSGVGFFVDPTPADDVEYIPSAALPTYLTADPADPVILGQFDLLSTAIHEIGHVLGISSGFESFASHIQPSQSGAHQAYVFASTPALGDEQIDYLAGFFLHGSALLPLMEANPDEGGSVGGLPSHLDDILSTVDTSGGLFPLDAMNPGLNVGERRLISNVDLDMLADAYGYTVVPEPSAALLLGLGLIGLTRVRARSKASRRELHDTRGGCRTSPRL
jgi:hypothetical protein